jgi:hypothetical protein
LTISDSRPLSALSRCKPVLQQHAEHGQQQDAETAPKYEP